ncbi:hypothetical protein D0T49_01180 [Paludibacter sp. 221]|nr:hypothetical protein [Paludibacter sp. 221]
MIFLTIIGFLFCGYSNSEQLYFIRTAIGEYEYYKLPPTQIISYTPNQDTLLHIYKDFTKELYQNYNRVNSLVYYPKVETFCFTVSGFKTYMLSIDNPDSIMEVCTQCPKNYFINSFCSIEIINNDWIYGCSNHKALRKEDVFIYKTIDDLDISPNAFKDIYLTGTKRQRVELRPHDPKMYLPIVADVENRPPFSVELPSKYQVDEKTYRVILVNDEQKMILSIKSVNPIAQDAYGTFQVVLYNKLKKEWKDIELKGNSPFIMTYGNWLAGLVQDGREWDEHFFNQKTSPGKQVRDSLYMENSFDEQAENYGFYRPGILYLLNTETGNYIEWETKQGDSEILLVQNESVYFRIFDSIYKASIIDGKKLGNAELLIKDNEIIPYVHWAFIK